MRVDSEVLQLVEPADDDGSQKAEIDIHGLQSVALFLMNRVPLAQNRIIGDCTPADGENKERNDLRLPGYITGIAFQGLITSTGTDSKSRALRVASDPFVDDGDCRNHAIRH